MARTPLARRLQEATAEVTERRTTGPRRRLLHEAGSAALAARRAGHSGTRRRWAQRPARVVVGGGLAGLTCAYQLRKAGFLAEVHEASDRLRRPLLDDPRHFAEGQIAEHGGELIDQGHTADPPACPRLGLISTTCLRPSRTAPNRATGSTVLRTRTRRRRTTSRRVWQKIHGDVPAASYPTLFNLRPSAARARPDVDHRLDRGDVDGGMHSQLGQLLDVAYNIEYGAESRSRARSTSCTCSAYTARASSASSGSRTRSTTSRRQRPDRRRASRPLLAGQIKTGLRARRDTAQRRRHVTLTFTMRLGTKTVTADKVVLAAAVLDPARSRLSQGRFLAAED